jgi:hypothetical protein
MLPARLSILCLLTFAFLGAAGTTIASPPHHAEWATLSGGFSRQRAGQVKAFFEI